MSERPYLATVIATDAGVPLFVLTGDMRGKIHPTMHAEGLNVSLVTFDPHAHYVAAALDTWAKGPQS